MGRGAVGVDGVASCGINEERERELRHDEEVESRDAKATNNECCRLKLCVILALDHASQTVEQRRRYPHHKTGIRSDKLTNLFFQLLVFSVGEDVRLQNKNTKTLARGPEIRIKNTNCLETQ